MPHCDVVVMALPWVGIRACPSVRLNICLALLLVSLQTVHFIANIKPVLYYNFFLCYQRAPYQLSSNCGMLCITVGAVDSHSPAGLYAIVETTAVLQCM